MNKETPTLKAIAVILCISFMVSGCVSTTVLSTTPSDADVYIKNQRVGKTPYTYSDRKIAGSSTLISFKKEGYEDYVTTIRKDKKLNVGALISGIFVYPLLWILGYGESYAFSLEEAEILQEPVAFSVNAKEESTAPAAPATDITDSIKLPTSSKVEKLLSQDQVDKAVEYAEDQEGTFQAGCYYAIALYYLDKTDYSAAEDYFSKSGKNNDGYVKIAEALMRGEIADTTLVINEKKIKTYLGKVYGSEEEITGKMAACYEKYADESKERIALAKKLKDMGMISMSSGGKTVSIDRSLSLSKAHAIFYLNSAINAFEILQNTEKVQELKNESQTILKDLENSVNAGQKTAVESTEEAPPVISKTKNIPVETDRMKLISEDDRVLICIDSIVRTSTQPLDLVAALKAGNSGLNTRPARNADYVLVYFNKTLKKELNLTSGEQELAKISLSDQSGKNYPIILERGHNYIKTPGGGQIWFNPDLPVYQGISKLERYEGVIIGYSYMMFFMPASTTPARLNYVYNFKNDKQDRKSGTSVLTMNLLQ